MLEVNHRNLRQIDVIPQEKLIESKVAIIGCGAIGRQVAIMLATMGVGEIHLIDHDNVSTENLGAQGHYEGYVGKPKVNATEDAMRLANSGPLIETHYKKIEDFGDFDWDKAPTAIFCCVDSMKSRIAISQYWAGGKGQMFIDGRMSVMTCRAVSALRSQEGDIQYYEKTLFPDGEATPSPCTAKSTFFTANIVSGIMVAMFVNRLLRDMPATERDVLMNMVSWTTDTDPEGVNQALDQPF